MGNPNDPYPPPPTRASQPPHYGSAPPPYPGGQPRQHPGHSQFQGAGAPPPRGNPGLVIGLLAGVVAIVGIGLALWLAGVFDGSSSTEDAPVDTATGASATITEPALDGLWSLEPGCSGLRITYGPGNRWRYDDGREGTYSFNGDTYTSVETGGPTTQMRIIRRDNATFETEDPRDGYRATRYRCTTGSAATGSADGGNRAVADQLVGRWCDGTGASSTFQTGGVWINNSPRGERQGRWQSIGSDRLNLYQSGRALSLRYTISGNSLSAVETSGSTSFNFTRC